MAAQDGGSWLDDFFSAILKSQGTRVARIGGPTGLNLNLLAPMTATANAATGDVDAGMPKATAAQDGYLAAADFATFAGSTTLAAGYYQAGAAPGAYPATLTLTGHRGCSATITETSAGAFSLQLTDTTTPCIIIAVPLGIAGTVNASLPTAGAFTIVRDDSSFVQTHAGFSFVAVPL